MKRYNVRPSVRPCVCPSVGPGSKPDTARFLRVGGIDGLLQERRAACGVRMRAVPRCQRT